MKQYLNLLKEIKSKGTHKEAAREGMPGTTSLFGHQMRFDLSEGFPLVTTKKVSFKNIVVELLWFLRGDTNIKYLVDNDCNIWNEDAYNYYLKVCKGKLPIELLGDVINEDGNLDLLTFEEFTTIIKVRPYNKLPRYNNYVLGDCGMQYGKLWRNWEDNISSRKSVLIDVNTLPKFIPGPITDDLLDELRLISKSVGILPIDSSLQPKETIDQIKDLIEGLKNNPLSRRHLITAWNPATLDDMALNACHALVQFNCREMRQVERIKELEKSGTFMSFMVEPSQEELDVYKIPRYKLDCQMYQRSADVFLGVPYNIASYALLTHILSKICNMIPGDFVHTFGDVHIYDNHMEQVDLQLTREPMSLPTLEIVDEGNDWAAISNLDFDLIEILGPQDFILHNYNSHPAIKGELSTGLKK